MRARPRDFLFVICFCATTVAFAQNRECPDVPSMVEFSSPFRACARTLMSTSDQTLIEATIEIEDAGRLPSQREVGLGLVAIGPRGEVAGSIVEITASPLHDPAQSTRMNVALFPSQSLRLGTPGIWRDLRVVKIGIVPCWEIDGVWFLVRRVVIKIENIGGDGVAELDRSPRPVSPMWERLQRSHVLNYDALHVPRLKSGTGNRYIVISRSRFDEQTPQFVEWKTRQGYGVELVTLEDLGFSDPRSREAINAVKRYLMHAFLTWPESPEFVLLVGDMYTGILSGSIYTKMFHGVLWGEDWKYYDQWYALLDGPDLFPDVLLGRFPDTNTERLAYELHKTIDYEMNPYIEGSWQRNALMTVDYWYYPDNPTIEVKQGIGDMLEGWGMDVTVLVNEEVYPANVISIVNQGLTFYNYRGQWCDLSGWAGLWDYDVQYVYNPRKLGIWTVLSCSSAEFNRSYTSTAELLLRRGYEDPSNPIGAVAFMGSQGYTWYTFNNALDVGFYKAFAESGASILGEVFVSAKMWMWNTTAHSDTQNVTMKEYTILGDPSLQVWTDVPQPMNVAVSPGAVPPGQTTQVAMTVTDSTGQVPVVGALVCLRRMDDVYAYGYTDEFGEIGLSVCPSLDNPFPSEAIDLTVTSYNMIPHFGSIGVEAASRRGAPARVVAKTTERGVQLVWDPVMRHSDGCPFVVDHYDVFRAPKAHFSIGSVMPIGKAFSNEFTDEWRSPGKAGIFYRIVAVSKQGDISPSSDAVGTMTYSTETEW